MFGLIRHETTVKSCLNRPIIYPDFMEVKPETWTNPCDFSSMFRTLLGITLIACLLQAFSGNAQEVDLPRDTLTAFEDLPFWTQADDTLAFSWFSSADTVLRPLVIFVHGGGFYTGTRMNPGIATFCNRLQDAGFRVASISYHLHLAGQDFHCDQPTANKIRAVEVAALDILRATAHFVALANEYHINPSKVFLIGSSAGAEAILHTAYWPRNRYPGADFTLPDGFAYAGLVALAGALENLDLVNATNAVPTMFFHGSSDPLVPFGTAIHHYCPKRTPGAWLLHGSGSIAAHMEALKASYHLHVACGAGHEMAGSPLDNHVADMVLFMERVLQGMTFQEVVTEPGIHNRQFGSCAFCD